MFKTLVNEAHISFSLHTESPLAIRSGDKTEMDPTALNMQCIRTRHGVDGEDGTVFIPGSSLKGVLRSRFERISTLFGGKCCNVVDRRNACKEIKNVKDIPSVGQFVYDRMCPACRFFGSTSIKGRVRFVDAYPSPGKPLHLGTRNGVGINRLTGAAQRGALYDFEVVEEGTFHTDIILRNYELYQLLLLLYCLKDLDEGYATLGAASTRGNGRMSVDDVRASFRDYRRDARALKGFHGDRDAAKALEFQKKGYYGEAVLGGQTPTDLDTLIGMLDDVNLQEAMRGDKPYAG